jgi:hypothetical protein
MCKGGEAVWCLSRGEAGLDSQTLDKGGAFWIFPIFVVQQEGKAHRDQSFLCGGQT